MSSNVARVLIDTSRPSELLRAVCSRLHVPAVVSHRLYAELVAKLGSDEAAVGFLLDLACQVGRPVLLNLPTKDGSTTVLLAPRGWSDERLRGWAGGLSEDLQAMFGPAELRDMEGAC